MNQDKEQVTKKLKRLRYDRIVAVFIIFVVVILIICLIHNASSGAEKKDKETVSSSSESTVPETSVHTGGRIEFQKIYKNYEDIHRGELILVNDNNNKLCDYNHYTNIITLYAFVCSA